MDDKQPCNYYKHSGNQHIKYVYIVNISKQITYFLFQYLLVPFLSFLISALYFQSHCPQTGVCIVAIKISERINIWPFRAFTLNDIRYEHVDVFII